MMIRTSQPQDYSAMGEHLDSAFRPVSGSFVKRYPHVWSPEKVEWDRVWIVEDNGKIESLVRIYPVDLILNQIPIRAAGLGSVSTSPSARGKGYMSELIPRALETMKSEGFPFSFLWGDRNRYNHFGYEWAGREICLSYTFSSLAKSGILPVAAAVYDGSRLSQEAIENVYEKNPYRRKYHEHEKNSLYALQGTTCFTFGADDSFAFAVVTDWDSRLEVVDFGGHPDHVLGILARQLESKRESALTLRFPGDHPIPEIYRRSACDLVIRPAAMVRLFDEAFIRKTLFSEIPTIQRQEGGDLERVESLFGVFRPGPLNFFLQPIDRV